MAEWSKALDSKSSVPFMVPWVQIPLFPPKYEKGRMYVLHMNKNIIYVKNKIELT